MRVLSHHNIWEFASWDLLPWYSWVLNLQIWNISILQICFVLNLFARNFTVIFAHIYPSSWLCLQLNAVLCVTNAQKQNSHTQMHTLPLPAHHQYAPLQQQHLGDLHSLAQASIHSVKAAAIEVPHLQKIKSPSFLNLNLQRVTFAVTLTFKSSKTARFSFN